MTAKRKGVYPRGGGGKHSYRQPKWKFDQLIVGLGTYRDVIDKLEARGFPRIPLSTLAGWRIRNSIPSFWVPAFIQLGLEERIIGNIDDLRVTEKHDHVGNIESHREP